MPGVANSVEPSGMPAGCADGGDAVRMLAGDCMSDEAA